MNERQEQLKAKTSNHQLVRINRGVAYLMGAGMQTKREREKEKRYFAFSSVFLCFFSDRKIHNDY
jgi:hypothetical protein